MITRYNGIGFGMAGPGVLMQVVGNVITRVNPSKEGLGIAITLAGTALALPGFAFIAMAKGRNPTWCLMAFLALIGLIVVSLLQDLEPERRRKKKRRPKYDEDDDDDWDRPRKKRKRRDDDDDLPDDELEDEAPRRKKKRRDDDDDLGPDEEVEDRIRPAKDRSRKTPSRTEDDDADEPSVSRPQSRPVKCPQCKKALKVPASAAGKKIKCPACGEVFPA